MKLRDLLIPDLKAEVKLTDKFIQRIPEDKLDWRPHEKSMSMRELGSHLADIPSWVTGTMETDEMSMDEWENPSHSSITSMVETLRSNAEGAYQALDKEDAEFEDKKWRMLLGGQVIWEDQKIRVLQAVMKQIPHHRAQLGVYLRLLGESVPATYGPSADEQA